MKRFNHILSSQVIEIETWVFFNLSWYIDLIPKELGIAHSSCPFPSALAGSDARGPSTDSLGRSEFVRVFFPSPPLHHISPSLLMHSWGHSKVFNTLNITLH